MANPIPWKRGEGYDVHLLRGGPQSKKLRDFLNITVAPDALAFIPNLAGTQADHGIEVNAQDGIVKAFADPPPKYKVHNFILSIVLQGPDGKQETEIRIHVHEAVERIWLTPSSLSVHMGTNEMRFTVLARFKDSIMGDATGVIGDITGCPELSYKALDPATHVDSADVQVSPDGVLRAFSPDKTAELTATLTLPDPFPTLTTAPATVRSKVSWADFAKNAIVTFVAGPVVPNKDDAASVKTVVDGAMNILFVSEGFRQEQRGDFNNLVFVAVEELRTKNYLVPFPLLKNSINFWSAFVSSDDEGITVLGDWSFDETSLKADLVPAPTKPNPTATKWSFSELIHEAGLPILEEVFQAGLPDYLTHWQKFYGPQVTAPRAAPFFLAWNRLAPRALLNERNSAFGIAAAFRPCAAGRFSRNADLRGDFRRTSDENLLLFATSLSYGGIPLGATWQKGQKDFGFVSFVCQSDVDRGQMLSNKGYFAATLGRNERLDLQHSAAGGLDVKTAPIEKNSRTLFASVWSHECGHVFGLRDEYGDGNGAVLSGTTVLDGPNLTTKQNVCSTSVSTGSTVTTFDKTGEIPWLWPRLAKAGLLDGKPVRATGGLAYQFEVSLRKGHGLPFKPGDIVRFRQWPAGTRASLDPFLKIQTGPGLLFKVQKTGSDILGLKLVDGTDTLVDVDAPVPSNPGQKSWFQFVSDLFTTGQKYTLIAPKIVGDLELKVIAEPIFRWLAKGPLNVEPDFDPGLCVPARDSGSIMLPINLPVLTRKPSSLADIIGLYEGGYYNDCGVYRPAGRCKMRAAHNKTLPFCFVCRYIIVDRVNPTQHQGLDAFYPEVST